MSSPTIPGGANPINWKSVKPSGDQTGEVKSTSGKIDSAMKKKLDQTAAQKNQGVKGGVGVFIKHSSPTIATAIGPGFTLIKALEENKALLKAKLADLEGKSAATKTPEDQKKYDTQIKDLKSQLDEATNNLNRESIINQLDELEETKGNLEERIKKFSEGGNKETLKTLYEKSSACTTQINKLIAKIQLIDMKKEVLDLGKEIEGMDKEIEGLEELPYDPVRNDEINNIVLDRSLKETEIQKRETEIKNYEQKNSPLDKLEKLKENLQNEINAIIAGDNKEPIQDLNKKLLICDIQIQILDLKNEKADLDREILALTELPYDDIREVEIMDKTIDSELMDARIEDLEKKLESEQSSSAQSVPKPSVTDVPKRTRRDAISKSVDTPQKAAEKNPGMLTGDVFTKESSPTMAMAFGPGFTLREGLEENVAFLKARVAELEGKSIATKKPEEQIKDEILIKDLKSQLALETYSLTREMMMNQMGELEKTKENLEEKIKGFSESAHKETLKTLNDKLSACTTQMKILDLKKEKLDLDKEIRDLQELPYDSVRGDEIEKKLLDSESRDFEIEMLANELEFPSTEEAYSLNRQEIRNQRDELVKTKENLQKQKDLPAGNSETIIELNKKISLCVTQIKILDLKNQKLDLDKEIRDLKKLAFDDNREVEITMKLMDSDDINFRINDLEKKGELEQSSSVSVQNRSRRDAKSNLAEPKPVTEQKPIIRTRREGISKPKDQTHFK